METTTLVKGVLLFLESLINRKILDLFLSHNFFSVL